MDHVDFEVVNADGEIISNTDPYKVETFKYHMKAIGEHFSYPSFHNSLILALLLFDTSHWSEKHTSQLGELKRIQSMSALSKDILEQGCSNIDADLGTYHLDELINSLAEMKASIGTKFNAATPSIKPILLENDTKVLTLIMDSFESIRQVFKYFYIVSETPTLLDGART